MNNKYYTISGKESRPRRNKITSKRKLNASSKNFQVMAKNTAIIFMHNYPYSLDRIPEHLVPLGQFGNIEQYLISSEQKVK